jgi:hypothetical protein
VQGIVRVPTGTLSLSCCELSDPFQLLWRVTDIPGGLRVHDSSGHALSYFYYWDAPNAANQIGVLALQEATFPQMPEFLRTGQSIDRPVRIYLVGAVEEKPHGARGNRRCGWTRTSS